jgi:hypothetical protein
MVPQGKALQAKARATQPAAAVRVMIVTMAKVSLAVQALVAEVPEVEASEWTLQQNLR